MDSFSYYDANGPADSNVATVYLTVYSVPVANDDSYQAVEGQTLTVMNAYPNVVAVADSYDDAIAAYDALQSVPNSFDAGWAYGYTLTGNAVDMFDSYGVNLIACYYIAIDPSAYSEAAALGIIILDSIDLNVLTQQVAQVGDNGVQANDINADGNPMTSVLNTPPTNGWVTLHGDGSFSYTSYSGFHGWDSFTYHDKNGPVDSNVATVDIYVWATPVANDDSYMTPGNTEMDIDANSGLLANDINNNESMLTPVWYTGPAHGTLLALNPDGSFSYVPDSGFTGTDSFTYYDATGLAVSNIATVTITVTPPSPVPPVANNDSYETAEGQTLTVNAMGAAPVVGVLADTNGDGYTAFTALSAMPTIATLYPSGWWVYSPLDDIAIETAVDNGCNAIVVYHDEPSDMMFYYEAGYFDVPVFVFNDMNRMTQFLAQYGADMCGGVLINDISPGGIPLTAVLNSSPTHGALTLNEDGSFSYTPNTGFYGQDSFTYYAADGTYSSNVATVSITVYATPTAANDSYAASAGQQLNVGFPTGVLANDSNPDGNPMTPVLNGWPQHGSLTFNTDGSFSYTPNAGFYGQDSFSYYDENGAADSNTATVTITIYSVPVANDDYYTDVENHLLAVPPDVAGWSDSTADGRTEYSALGDMSNIDADVGVGDDVDNGTLDAGWVSYLYYSSGVTVFAVWNTTPDPSAFSAAADLGVTILVSADLTTLMQEVAQYGAPGLLANDTNADGNPLTSVLNTPPANGSLLYFNGNGTFCYQPNAGFSGTDSFTYYDTNGPAQSNVATVMITVYSTPVAHDDDYQLISNPDGLVVDAAQGVLANDSNPDGSPLTAVLHTKPGVGPLLAFNPDGSFTYWTPPGYYGTDSFTYYDVSDTATSNVATVYITVNSYPVAEDDHYAAAENQELDVAADDGVLANDFNADGNPLTAVLNTPPASGAVTLNNDGSFSYMPDPGFYGTDSFTYYAVNGPAMNDLLFDGESYESLATVYLTVYSTPIAGDDYYTDAENQTLTVLASVPYVCGWTDNGSDADTEIGALASLSNIAQAAQGNDADEGALDSSWVDKIYGFGIPVIAVWHTTPDPSAYSEAANLDMIILDSMDLHVLAQELAQLGANGVQDNDYSLEGNLLTSVLNTPPANGSVTLNGDGSFSYTPNAGFWGMDSFTYYDENGPADSNVATVTITVHSTPVAHDDDYQLISNPDGLVVDAAQGVLANDSNPTAARSPRCCIPSPASARCWRSTPMGPSPTGRLPATMARTASPTMT